MKFQNKGMHLESIINYTIEIYNSQKKALFFKAHPKIVINQGKYYFLNQSTVDYHGVYKGKYICFEAKTTDKNYLSWQNIKTHQWYYLLLANKQSAISFIIIYFSIFEKYYLVFVNQLINLKQKKSKITFEWVNKNGYEIEFAYPFLLNFIKII